MEKLDVVILGATGFSGKYIVKMLARIDRGIKWGIAGRSINKLKGLMDVVDITDINNKSTSRIFVCDANDKDSLIELCNRTKVLVNCIGPYMNTGHAVVEACIQCGTHYLDITVEMHYILDITRRYNQSAEEANVLIIPACGLVSVVASMGFMYLDDHFSGTIKSVELYSHIRFPKEFLYPNSKNCLMHACSLDTTFERISNRKEFEKLSQEMLPNIEIPTEMKRSFMHYRYGKIWVPGVFPDESIANMSQKYLKETKGKPYIPFKMYNSCTFSFFYILMIPFVLLFCILSSFKCFQKVVCAHPEFWTCGYISHKGPDAEILKKIRSHMVLEAKGWTENVKDFSLPLNKLMKLEITSYDGYQTTADAMMASILTLLEEHSKMPRGGVINCGAAFRRTKIVQKLQQFGVRYEISDN